MGFRIAIPMEQNNGKQPATVFKGPADFCAFPNSKGLMVVVPDLVKGESPFVQLGK